MRTKGGGGTWNAFRRGAGNRNALKEGGTQNGDKGSIQNAFKGEVLKICSKGYSKYV